MENENMQVDQPGPSVVEPQVVQEQPLVIEPQPVVVEPQPVEEEVFIQIPKRVKREVTSNTVASYVFDVNVTFPQSLPGALDGQEFTCYTLDRRWVTMYTQDQQLHCEEGDVRMWKNKIYYFV
jgi:hypothetical protein